MWILNFKSYSKNLNILNSLIFIFFKRFANSQIVFFIFVFLLHEDFSDFFSPLWLGKSISASCLPLAFSYSSFFVLVAFFCFCHALPACGNCGDCHCNMVDIATTSHSSNVTPQGNSISGKQDNYEHVKCCDKSHAALHLPHLQWAAAAPAAAFLSHDWGIKLANKFVCRQGGRVGNCDWLLKNLALFLGSHTHTHVMRLSAGTGREKTNLKGLKTFRNAVCSLLLLPPPLLLLLFLLHCKRNKVAGNRLNR